MLIRDREWRQKRQDILIAYVGSVPSKVKQAVGRIVKDAKNFGADVRGRPTLRADLPPGHPRMLGIEHSDPVIMTVTVHCSMEQVIELLMSNLPSDMHVVPIPSERCIVD